MKKKREPQFYTSDINNRVLNYHEYYMSIQERVIYSSLTILVGGLVGYLFYGGLFQENGQSTSATRISNLVVFLLFGLISNRIFMKTIRCNLHMKRKRVLSAQFRDFLSALSTSLSGGANINEAMKSSYEDVVSQYGSDAYITKEVEEIIAGTENGLAIEHMIDEFGKRSGIDDISNFAIIFQTCYRKGGNMKEVIRRTSDIISEKIMIKEEITTTLTSNKMQMYVMNVIPIVVIALLRLSSSKFNEAFASFMGVAALTIGAICFIGAYVLGQRIMNIRE